jgi:uncharacterized protein YaaQ
MTSPNTNYGVGSTHDYRKEVMDIVRPQVEQETRMEMAKEPSHEVVDKEVAYRIGVEEGAANKLSQDELRVVYQLTPSIKPSQYLANK